MKKNLKVTIAQFSNQEKGESSQDIYDESNGMRYKNSEKQREKIEKGIHVAKQDKADFLIFPELFVPNKYISQYISNISEKLGIIIIGGIEWVEKNRKNDQKKIGNEAFIAIPGEFEKTQLGVNTRGNILRIPKLFAADSEEKYLQEAGYEFARGNKIYLFENKKLGNWAVLICVDYINLQVHKLLQKKIQTLIIVAHNRDINYYLSVSDSLHRILYCNIIVCNSGYYGGSHVFSPYRERHQRKVYQTLGNHVEAAVTVELPLKILKEAQGNNRGEQNKELVARPADYSYLR